MDVAETNAVEGLAVEAQLGREVAGADRFVPHAAVGSVGVEHSVENACIQGLVVVEAEVVVEKLAGGKQGDEDREAACGMKEGGVVGDVLPDLAGNGCEWREGGIHGGVGERMGRKGRREERRRWCMEVLIEARRRGTAG